ncbi:MAG: squalene/phytoene synthase family protein, partial [Verrucomicrobiota bacterium]|nr:squalene/phytoene synthase family protein [Verrucomicrobiota bacterium]
MDAAKITRQSKSNLALAFVSLGKEQRQDITTFYAFCRIIDDIADATELNVEAKREGLTAWRRWLRAPAADEAALAGDIRALIAKYRLTPEMLEEIIAGVEMDLTISRYATFAELRLYCYRVASAVGLVSIEIFGYRNAQCREYAVALGLALQTTNIIRDVGKDLRIGRVYLPQEEMAQFGLNEADLLARRYDDRFVALMKSQAARSHAFYDEAARLLPREDRRTMVAAEIMASVYRTLLRRIEADGFQ